jgi:hypothetical protein
MNEASVMFVGRVVTKSSAVSVSSLPVLAVRDRVAIWPSGLPVLKKNGTVDGTTRGSNSSQRMDKRRERRTRVGRGAMERQSEKNMVGLLKRKEVMVADLERISRASNQRGNRRPAGPVLRLATDRESPMSGKNQPP